MKLFFSFALTLFAAISIGQPLRIHLLGGFSNYNGDLQQKRFTLEQAKGAIGGGFTYDITDHFSARADAIIASVGADDKRSKRPDLIARNLNFTSPIYELSLLGEYNLFSLKDHKFSPYVFGGVGIFHFNPYTHDAAGNKVFLSGLSTEGEGFLPGKNYYKRTDLNIPIGGGIKYALSDDLHAGFELGLRVLKTDYLDDVSNAYVDRNLLLAARGQMAVDYAFRGGELKDNPRSYPDAGSQRGNNKVNDFYYFGLLRLDFRISSSRTSGGGRRGLNCPPKF
jgi:hypothetical protein